MNTAMLDGSVQAMDKLYINNSSGGINLWDITVASNLKFVTESEL